MNDEMTVTLYAQLDGALYCGEELSYSVATYCYNMLGKHGDDEHLRTLLVDILNYGAATQTYTGYNTSSLANASLTTEQKAWASPDRTFETVENNAYEAVDTPMAEWYGAGLDLSESIAVRYEFDADSIDGLSATITCGGETWQETAFTKNDEGKYVLSVSVNAGYMDAPICVTLCKGGTAVSNTACYSIESYAYTYGEDAELGALVRAMIKYGDSAKTYIS